MYTISTGEDPGQGYFSASYIMKKQKPKKLFQVGIWSAVSSVPCTSDLNFFFFFLAVPHSMQDLSTSARDWTHAPWVEAWSLNHWTAREVPRFEFQFQCYHLPFLCYTFIFVGQFPLSVIHLCKMSCGFIAGRPGGKTTARSDSLNSRCAVTSHQQNLKRVTWLVTAWAFVICTVICGLKS